MRTAPARALAVMAVMVIPLSMGVAQARDYPEYVKKACKADFKKYCPSYDINSKSLRACMRAMADDLKPRCAEALERSGERR